MVIYGSVPCSCWKAAGAVPAPFPEHIVTTELGPRLSVPAYWRRKFPEQYQAMAQAFAEWEAAGCTHVGRHAALARLGYVDELAWLRCFLKQFDEHDTFAEALSVWPTEPG